MPAETVELCGCGHPIQKHGYDRNFFPDQSEDGCHECGCREVWQEAGE